jgi:hypothetical protein
MPTLAARTPKAKARSPRSGVKLPGRRRRIRGPSFAEGMRPFIGMIKNAPADLSMREGFGR